MSAPQKKQTRKEKDALSRQSAASPARKQVPSSSPVIYGILAALLGFVLYANTLGHKFTLDDTPALTENLYVQKGISGIGDILSTAYWSGYRANNTSLYRPLPLIVFAIEWQFFPDQPVAGHVVNVLLFSLTGFLLFRLLCRLLPANILVSFAATLVFMAHPVHTEVVASIKSCDEILCLLFCILSLRYLLDHDATRKSSALLLSAVCFFLALLSKENAITWLAIFPLALFVFRKKSIRTSCLATLPYLVVAVIYLAILLGIQNGHLVTGGAALTNNVLSGAPLAARLATALFVLGKYLWLLLFPFHLSMDYSFPEISLRSFADPLVWLSLVAIIAIGSVGFILARKRNPLGFGLLFILLTLSIVSNIPFLIGTIMADRLLYMPSLGMALVLVLFMARITKATAGGIQPFSALPAPAKWTLALTGVVVLFFSVKTIARNRVWENNLALFASGMDDAPSNSYVRYLYANELIKSARPDVPADSLRNDSLYAAALGYYSRAIELNPKHAASYSEMGATYRRRKMPVEALRYYSQALRYNPRLAQAYNGMGVIYFEQKNYREALKQFSESVRLNSVDATALRNLGSCYLLLGDSRNAIATLQKSLQYNPNDAAVLQYLGFAYEDQGDKAMANAYFEKARNAKN